MNSNVTDVLHADVGPMPDRDILITTELLVAQQNALLAGAEKFLRDYFAGQAVAGMMASGNYSANSTTAHMAYTLADAMLAAREKKSA